MKVINVLMLINMMLLILSQGNAQTVTIPGNFKNSILTIIQICHPTPTPQEVLGNHVFVMGPTIEIVRGEITQDPHSDALIVPSSAMRIDHNIGILNMEDETNTPPEWTWGTALLPAGQFLKAIYFGRFYKHSSRPPINLSLEPLFIVTHNKICYEERFRAKLHFEIIPPNIRVRIELDDWTGED